ncbi:MAG: formylglycine-generating enzyme family protein, partial [Prevotellaceae bacterium]|nr:formylglycine-generating enzyme family protein [Prevotellaceae bacterium]
AARLGSDLNRDGEYELQTKANNTAVALKLTALRAQTTPVDTTGLAAWGKANEIDLVQLVVQAPDYGGMKTSRVAQLVDCNTGKLSERGMYRMVFTPKGVDINAVIELVPVAGGVFEMGCKDGRDGTCISNETLHWVKVNDFHIGKYPITQAQWRAVMGWLPSSITSTYKGDSKPVIFVSYNEIVHPDTGFLAKLNVLTGKNYRLPTEAEWEYAARGCDAGACESKLYSGSTIIGDVAYYGKSSGGPTTVGTLSPNALGIYDMSGNVWEWCYDYYGGYSSSSESSPVDNPTGPTTLGSDRMLRGGSWDLDAKYSRVAHRNGRAPSARGNFFGFRVVMP